MIREPIGENVRAISTVAPKPSRTADWHYGILQKSMDIRHDLESSVSVLLRDSK
jgi:hypothetical protein